jgi:hypothetical protein
MKRHPLMNVSERWFTLLQRLYPADFRDEMGTAMVEAYLDRARVPHRRPSSKYQRLPHRHADAWRKSTAR